MAGFFTKNDGYVYDGELAFPAGVAIKSGDFVEVDSGILKLAATNVAGYKFEIVEVTEYDGDPAVRVNVIAVGAAPVYMAEVVITGTDELYAEHVAKVGDPVRKRRPMLNDQILVNVASTSGMAVGDELTIAAGKLVKA